MNGLEVYKVQYHVFPETTTTAALVTLRNGFTLLGRGPDACNEEVGRTLALQRALDQIPALLAFKHADEHFTSTLPGQRALTLAELGAAHHCPTGQEPLGGERSRASTPLTGGARLPGRTDPPAMDGRGQVAFANYQGYGGPAIFDLVATAADTPPLLQLRAPRFRGVGEHMGFTMSDRLRITDEDAELIASKLESRLVEHFHVNLGKGVWALAWKAILVSIVLFALYGSVKGGFPRLT